MASYELIPFEPFDHLYLVAAIEQKSNHLVNIGYWVRDPNQVLLWPENTSEKQSRLDFLWNTTCFEVFIGIKDNDHYREINLSPSTAWQVYQFEEYRYPDTVPPTQASDVKISQLQRTPYGINAHLDLTKFIHDYELEWSDLYFGLTAVLKTHQGTKFYALQHSSPSADFHNKRDWLHRF